MFTFDHQAQSLKLVLTCLVFRQAALRKAKLDRITNPNRNEERLSPVAEVSELSGSNVATTDTPSRFQNYEVDPNRRYERHTISSRLPGSRCKNIIFLNLWFSTETCKN